MPSFQFSLRWLMVGVTALCAVSALVAPYPKLFAILACVLAAIVPALVTAGLAKQKVRAFSTSLVGAYVLLIFGSAWSNRLFDTPKDELSNLMLVSVLLAAGGVLAGGVVLLIDLAIRLRKRGREV